MVDWKAKWEQQKREEAQKQADRVARLERLHEEDTMLVLDPPSFSRQSLSDAGGHLEIRGSLGEEGIAIVRIADQGSALYLEDIQICKVLRNKGYGSRVLSWLEVCASAEGFSEISGKITGIEGDDVERLKHFYGSRGYVVGEPFPNGDRSILKQVSQPPKA